MATLVVAPRALGELQQLIRSHELPDTTLARLEHVIEPLTRFPQMGSRLSGRWSGYRYVLGPWRWMIVLYFYDEPNDRVGVVSIQDARRGSSATNA